MNHVNIRTNDEVNLQAYCWFLIFSTYHTSLYFKMKCKYYVNKTLNNKTLEN